MSIQFRSRIKSSADYGSFLSDVGVCCFPDGSKQYPVTYMSCMEGKGYFQYKQENEDIEDIECPELSSKGCCCACEYVDNFDDYLNSISQGIPNYMGGLQDDVTFCECSFIGGVWLGRDTSCSEVDRDADSIFAFCTNGTSNNPKIPDPIDDDVRFPSGCCVDEGTGLFTCYNVCSEEECSNKQTESNPNGTGVYYATVACGDDPTIPDEDEIDCGDSAYRSETVDGGNSIRSKNYNNILIGRKTFSKDSEIRYNNTRRGSDGLFSACIQKDSCEVTTINNCNGYWLGLRPEGVLYDCSDKAEIDIIKTFIKNGTVSSSVVDSWEVGSYQLGGFYVGKYWSSDGPYGRLQGYGNPDTGEAKPYIMETDEKNFKSFSKHKYAVIISPRDLETTPLQFHRKNITNSRKFSTSSKFDSVRNMNSNFELFNRVKDTCGHNGINSSHINACVIPSLHLSAFIYDKINNDSLFMSGVHKNSNPAYYWMTMNKTYWTSTTVKNSPNRTKMSYVQDFDSGFVSACGWKMYQNVRTVHLARII